MPSRFKPAIAPGTSDYSLLDTQTGVYSMIEQGFGVCDRVADELNFGHRGPISEVSEIADNIRRNNPTVCI